MSETSLRVVARVRARPDSVGRVRELLAGLVDPTREEPGCVSYELLQNNDDPTDFTFVEEWRSEAALEAHLSSDHLEEVLPELEPILADSPDIRTYSVVR